MAHQSEDVEVELYAPSPNDIARYQPTYRYSYMSAETPGPRRSSDAGSRLSSSSGPGGEVFVRGSLLDRTIEAAPPISNAKGRPERARDYKGRRRIWPGILFLVAVCGTATFLVAYYGRDAWTSSHNRGDAFELKKFEASKIKTRGNKTNNTPIGGDIIEDDGIIGNPKKYPPSRNGQAIPLGLWENSQNGTSVYQIASFLASNKFNGVRLPLMADWILKNHAPNAALLNKQENRAIDASKYMPLLKGIVKALGYRQIGVLISMHTLTFEDNGALWYNEIITEEKFLESIDILTKNLCNKEYWNIMGIDLKNEPHKGTWGDGGPTDFRDGSIRIANRMLKGCPKWMGFIEGVNAQHKINIDGETFNYYDWFGGGLQGARTKGVEFSIPNKVVWAPHYYTPAVFPQYYLFGGGKVVGSAITGFVELEDDKLRRRIKATMDHMFGFLASETGPALLLGEFGGLYSKDTHPMKTTKRCTDFSIEIIKRPGWAGGFVWSLNPESEYQYNPADQPGRFFEGVLTDDWLAADDVYLNGLAAMDDMENLRPFPCFPTTGTDKSKPSSGSGSS
ncbi:hypothetical protein P43SY_004185 [Pythium insidiosum]|uniref:Glycoside hydrolase family 5 domain-containing protein n=1 Tax=Pythium insidiosum TaxID=114742 RepID=A0AAD5M0K0_PYTIN|nr:hypothetical protein P43SY_004185 [Pythium insidiosum]KAJ0392645.1 hypothetical protein ATCC90586_011616 [Pythium insidiosum]